MRRNPRSRRRLAAVRTWRTILLTAMPMMPRHKAPLRVAPCRRLPLSSRHLDGRLLLTAKVDRAGNLVLTVGGGPLRRVRDPGTALEVIAGSYAIEQSLRILDLGEDVLTCGGARLAVAAKRVVACFPAGLLPTADAEGWGILVFIVGAGARDPEVINFVVGQVVAGGDGTEGRVRNLDPGEDVLTCAGAPAELVAARRPRSTVDPTIAAVVAGPRAQGGTATSRRAETTAQGSGRWNGRVNSLAALSRNLPRSCKEAAATRAAPAVQGKQQQQQQLYQGHQTHKLCSR